MEKKTCEIQWILCKYVLQVSSVEYESFYNGVIQNVRIMLQK